MSTNLGFPQLTEGQASPEVTVNDIAATLDAAITETFTADVTSGNVSLTNLQFREMARINITNATVAARTVTVPAIKRYFIVTSDSANTQTVAVVRGSTSISVAPAEARFFFTDGTANGLTSFAIGSVFDVAAFLPGLLVNGALAMLYVTDRAFTLPINLTGSKAYATTAPADAAQTITIKKNGASIGTVNIAQTTGAITFTFAAAVSFAVGDRLSLHCPSPADSALADVAVNLFGSR